MARVISYAKALTIVTDALEYADSNEGSNFEYMRDYLEESGIIVNHPDRDPVEVVDAIAFGMCEDSATRSEAECVVDRLNLKGYLCLMDD